MNKVGVFFKNSLETVRWFLFVFFSKCLSMLALEIVKNSFSQDTFKSSLSGKLNLMQHPKFLLVRIMTSQH